MWREIKGHVNGRRKFYALAFPPPNVDTSFEDTRGDERLCHCVHCTCDKSVAPVYNHGKYEVVKNPSGLRGHESEWGVAGPYPYASHCGATWKLEDKAQAEEWCEKMQRGEFPKTEVQ